ncbi:MAG: aldolase/citrate lyase family protein [Acidobacteria bacterium]|nr:aldolase/citrate lyase family protein [Acidobacteriota bacterium]
MTLQPLRSGGLALSVKSKVEPYYGLAIDEQLRAALKALGVRHARVELDDAGALPFVLAARLEAAARRAGVAGGDARPPRLAPTPAPSVRDRRRRSRLYVPGAEPKFMVNAGLYGADGVILDLEDSVHPAEKDAARLLVRNALRTIDFGGAERMVRINQLPLGLDDLEAVVPEGVDLVLIPKVETPAQVREAAERIATVARRVRRRAPVWLMPILESALGIENAFAIARAHPTVAALTIGLEDYTADLGVVKTPEGAETDWARRRLVNAARAAGVQAIDSVYGDVADLEGLAAWARRSRAMGFEGMGCVHPRQIPVIHEGFAPTATELEKAARIVAAFEEAQAKGLGVVSLGSKMIDPPVVKRALALVARAKA